MSDMFTTLVEHCGRDTAEAILHHFGGMCIYVPAKWTPEHMLNAMGEAHARKFIEQFGLSKLEVPRHKVANKRRTQLIRALSAGGHSRNAVARATGVTERWVRMTMARQRAEDDSQGELF